MLKSLYILILVWACMQATAIAQKKMQVVTRITEETYEFNRDFILELDAEKANIHITKSEGNKVHVVLKQSVKNQSLKLAESHLNGHKFVFKDEKDRLYIRNYILFNNTQEEVTSLYSSQYEITVPKNCHIKITNSLGDVNLENLSGAFRLNINYGKVLLDNCSGKLDANMNIGDLVLKNSFLGVTAETHNVVINVMASGGKYDLNTNFGSLSYVLSPETGSVNIKSDNTDLTFINKENLLFNYDVQLKNGLINVISGENVEKENDVSILKSTKNNAVGNISIQASYGDISIY